MFKKLKIFIYHSKYLYKIWCYLFSILLYIYINFVRFTSRVKFHLPNEYDSIKKSSLIYCFWHGNIMATFLARKVTNKTSVLLSSGQDGQLVALLLKIFGIGAIRGSTNRNNREKRGVASLKEMLKTLKSKKANIAITPDGPVGPLMAVSSSISWLSIQTKTPIIAINVATSCGVRLKNWDKMLIILPFSKINIYLSEPIYPPKLDHKVKKEDAIKEYHNFITKRLKAETKKVNLINPDAKANL